MRFNQKEISVLAQQQTTLDMEGYLQMKDKQEGIFKKTEGECFIIYAFLPLFIN